MNDAAKKEIDKITEIEKTVDREKLLYRASEYTYSFQNFRTIRAFGREIYNGKITLKEADEDQASLLNEIIDFREKTKPEDEEKKKKKKHVLTNLYKFFEGREKVLNAFDSKIFPIKTNISYIGYLESEPFSVKILTPNQMFKRLPIALAQIKAGNNSQSLLNEIRQIVYSLYRSKEITKKVYNNIINSIKV